MRSQRPQIRKAASVPFVAYKNRNLDAAFHGEQLLDIASVCGLLYDLKEETTTVGVRKIKSSVFLVVTD